MDPRTLKDREKAVLRLLHAGHDAKSSAQVLGLSVHTVNERLRDARRALGVTSSREAARLLAAVEAERTAPESVGDRSFGLPDAPRPGHDVAGRERRSVVSKGLLMWSFPLFALLGAGVYLYAGTKAVEPKVLPPRVIATTPGEGAAIAPGPFVLSVTFDRPMTPASYSFVQVSRDTFPECTGQPRQSADERTFALSCTAVAGRSYEVWFNRGHFRNFRDGTAHGVPHRLTFRVTR